MRLQLAIVVIGPGAIGLLCAIRLADGGQSVTLLGRATTVTRLAGQPLELRQDDHVVTTSSINLISDPAELARSGIKPDLAVVCVKGYDTPSVLPILDTLTPTTILTLQNGIGNEESIATHIGSARVISGAITTSVELPAPGHVTITKTGGIGLAPLPNGPDPLPWVQPFSAAGFRVQTYPDYQAMKWSKALLNILGNATSAILDMPVDHVYADPRLVALERRAFLEGVHTMQRFGAHPVNLPRYPAALLAQAMQHLPAPLLYPLLRHLIAGGRGGKPPSLHLDLLNGNKRSEGALLYGAIADRAEQLGVPAPTNHALWQLLRSIVSGQTAWETFRHRPDALLAAVAHDSAARA